MADPWSLLIGAIGAIIGGAIQHAFRRYAETEQVRREVVETHLLQLQDSVESLYYRTINLQGRGGQLVMPEDYYYQTSVYILGRVLAQEALLVARSVYAKLHRAKTLKRKVKARLHAINWSMDDQVFLHYHRVQLSEMLLDGNRVISYTEFLERWGNPEYATPVAAATQFVKTVEPERLKGIRMAAGELVALLEKETKVPSAKSLATDGAVGRRSEGQ